MRDVIRAPQFWTDAEGNAWRVSTTLARLNFNYPAHAALRVHVFKRDAYRCCRCHVCAVDVPERYDGRDTLHTALLSGGRPLMLVLDHVLPRAAGGSHTVENLQTLCETCNRRKVGQDKVEIARYRDAGAMS